MGVKAYKRALKCLGLFTEKLLFYVGISFICIQQEKQPVSTSIVEHQHRGLHRGWEGHLLIFLFQILTYAHTYPCAHTHTMLKSSPPVLCSAVGPADSWWKGRCANRQKIDPALCLSSGLKSPGPHRCPVINAFENRGHTKSAGAWLNAKHPPHSDTYTRRIPF